MAKDLSKKRPPFGKDWKESDHTFMIIYLSLAMGAVIGFAVALK